AVGLDGDATDAAGGPRELFCTHGHVWGPGIDNSVDRMPPLPAGSALLYGHTHIKVDEERPLGVDGSMVHVLNPGSVSIPKDGSHSYGLYEDGRFRLVELG
ncbi:MAG: metallophosphoesterase family protein, partial [Atopobiaceae bacterium]|nr:metallophosphoesterase family protein [Atopobiaceae bacterium]